MRLLSMLVVAVMAPYVVLAQGFGDIIGGLQNGTLSNNTKLGALLNNSNSSLNGSINGSGNATMPNATQPPQWSWSDAKNRWVWQDGTEWQDQAKATVQQYWPMVLAWVSILDNMGVLQNGVFNSSILGNLTTLNDQEVGCFRLNMQGVEPTLIDDGKSIAASSAETSLVASLVSTLVALLAVAGIATAVVKKRKAKQEKQRLDSLIKHWQDERKTLPETMTFKEMEQNEQQCVVWEEDVVAMLATALVEEEELRQQYAEWGLDEGDYDEDELVEAMEYSE